MRIFGVVIVACALLIAGVAQLYNCQQDGKAIQLRDAQGNPTRTVPMKCYWTAEAELVTGGSLLLIGGMMALRKRKLAQEEDRRNLAVLGTALGAFTILLPTVLIGVCTDMTASCNEVMRPAMILLGAVVIAASLGWGFLPGRRLGLTA